MQLEILHKSGLLETESIFFAAALCPFVLLRKIHKQAYTNSGNFKQVIELGNIESGLYLMTVSDGQRKNHQTYYC